MRTNTGMKFSDPLITAAGETRASVPFSGVKTLWFNTGTLCNIACANCYIESSPRNDRLVYITESEVRAYLDEIAGEGMLTEEIGLTGGEPFMNREIIPMMRLCLERGFRLLVLTNAMKPMMRFKEELAALKEAFPETLTLRVSVDHYTQEKHEEERGAGAWAPMLAGLVWLSEQGFRIDAAGRLHFGESEAEMRAGYKRLFAEHNIHIDADDPARLMLFPEMDAAKDVPEITEQCWDILGKKPDSVMCASSRMVIKRKGAARPAVVSCTLLPYDEAFELGATLKEAHCPVPLNHPHCAAFCVLGGASCSA